MRFFLENTELGVFENETVEVQLNNPLKDYKMTGDKAHAFSVPNSPIARKALAGRAHLQSVALPDNFTGRIQHGPVSILEGKTALKASSDRALSFQMDVAPGNISADVWNKDLGDFDFGSYSLNTKTVIEPIGVLNLTTVGQRSDNGNDALFGDYWLRNACTYRVFQGVNIVWEHTVALEGYDRDVIDSLILSDLQASAAAYNESPTLAGTEIYVTKEQLVFVSNSSGSLIPNLGFSILVRPYLLSDSRDLGFGINFMREDYEQISYETAKDDLVGRDIRSLASGTMTDPFIFPTVFAPRFYNDASVYYCGSVNHKNYGGMATNTFKLRTTYPMVPAFRWLWIIDSVLAAYDYKREGDEWADWENFCLMAMKDFARQCPGLNIPYNVYPVEMVPAKYMPDYTLREFFDEYAKATGCILIWDIPRKRLRMRYLADISSDTPYELAGGSYQLIETRYDALRNYDLQYSGVISDEYLTEEIEVFLGKKDNNAETEENLETVNQQAVPLLAIPEDYDTKTFRMYDRHPERNQDGWVGNPTDNTTPPTHFCYVSGQSVLFNLQAVKPQVRSLFMVNYQVATTATYSLSREGESTVYEAKIKPLLDKRTGKTSKVVTYLSLVDLQALNFERCLFYKGLKWLVISLNIKAKGREKYLYAELELEVLK
ncbi:MAG: hypothetical protein NXI00_10850 [Cytophagales bacterium]|nr:hypothetical protein [Cytophagales bacterium]